MANPIGARLVEENIPRGAKIKEEETAKQFVAGIDDVTSILARPFEKAFGTLSISAKGIEALSPEETTLRRERGELGLVDNVDEPTSLIGKGLRVAGQTAATGPLLGKVASLIPAPAAVTSKIGQIAKFPQKILSEAGQTFAKSPIASTTIETGLGFTAGAGGFISGKIFPDSDVAVFLGEVAGGVAPSLIPATLAVRAGKSLRNFITRPFSKSGIRSRVEQRIFRATTEEQRREALRRLRLPTTVDQSGQPVLTSATRSGEPGLLSLERAILESSEDLLQASDVSIANANKVIQDSLQDIGEGSLESTKATIVESQKYLSSLLDTNIRIAAQKTDERILQLGPKASREQLNIIARENIKEALDAAVAQEKELYDAISDEFLSPTVSAQQKLASIIKETGIPARGDIPAIANKFLNKQSSSFLGDEVSIKDIRALQSKLREVARNARAGDKKNLNKARIADEIANSITDDLGKIEGSNEIKIAVEFSRDLNERFGSKTLSKILGRNAVGTSRTASSLTLEDSIGLTGPKARQALDELVKAFDSPEAPSSNLLIESVEDFTRSRFLKDAVVNGEINDKAAFRFLKNNEELLSRLPEVRQQIDDALQSNNILQLRRRQSQRVSFDDFRISKATLLLEKGPVEAFKQIRGSRSPVTEMNKLVNLVSKDKTGESLKGLKAGMMRFLMGDATKSTRDELGKRFLSGFSIKENMDSLPIQTILSSDEIKRLNVVVRDLIRLENRLSAKLPKEGIISDKPAKIIEILAGISGARAGSLLSRVTGGGGPIQIPAIMSNAFRQMSLSGVRDPSKRMLIDAILFDEKLFKELLNAKDISSPKKVEQISRRLNAWSIAVLSEYGGREE